MGIWAPSLDNVFEVYGTRSENFDRGAYSQTVTVRVPYNEAYALINEIIGVNVRSPLPDYTNNEISNLYLVSAVIVPVDDDAPAGPGAEYYLYNECNINLVYSTAVQQKLVPYGLPPFKPWDPVDYLEVFEPRAEHQILDFKDYHWGTAPDEQNLKPEEAPTRTLYSGTYTVYWFNQLTIPDEYYSLTGSVNLLEFISPNLRWWTGAYPTVPFRTNFEQMLYLPAGYSNSLEWQDVTKTEKGYNYACKWMLKLDANIEATGDNTWNTFYRKTEAGAYVYDSMILKDGEIDYDVYRQKDHTPLLPS